MITRFALGIGESGNFPAGVKAVAEWFPKKERAFAVGIFNAGANIGAVIAGSFYLLALLVIHLLVPRMEEAKLAERA